MSYECIALEESDIALRVAQGLKRDLHIANYRQFADGEINVTVADPEQYAGKAVIILQSTGDPVNEHTLGVAFLAHELKNAGATRVIAAIPYFGYARQERSAIKGKPGNVHVIAQLYQAAGIDAVVTIDVHEPQIIDFFSIPVHNLQVQPLLAAHITKQVGSHKGVCLVAPDKGAQEYVQQVARSIDVGTLTFSKERFAADQTRVLGHEGSCRGTTGIIIDDIIATGGTAISVADALPQLGYASVYGYFVHPVLAGNAVERIDKSSFEKIFVSNTLALKKSARNNPKIAVFDVSAILVEKLHNLIA